MALSLAQSLRCVRLNPTFERVKKSEAQDDRDVICDNGRLTRIKNILEMHDKRFPNESTDYRDKRNALLKREHALRLEIEAVAKQRRDLPPGGALKSDYVFEEVSFTDGATESICFSDLFGDKENLIVYSYMYGPDWNTPCPSCTSVIDGLNAASRHVRQQAELVVVGKASAKQLHEIAVERHWNDLRLLSSLDNDYTRDYLSQPGSSTKALMPLINVFRRDASVIRHTWGSETLWVSNVGGAEPRHVDLIWPMWGLLDMTASGRDPEIGPRLNY